MAVYYIYPFSWVGVWRENEEYLGGQSPIRVGGSTGYRSLIGGIDPQSLINRIESSVIPARVYLNVYGTFQDDVYVNIGMHREVRNKGSSGTPSYNYAGATTLGVGWQRIDLTNISVSGINGFLNILKAGYQGPVMYAATNDKYGEYYGVTGDSYTVWLEVTGQWSAPPGKPTIIAPTAGTIVEGLFELRATEAIDPTTPASDLQYEWQIYDGRNTYNLGLGPRGKTNKLIDFSFYNETNRAQVAVRAANYDWYSAWQYSDRFSITKNHPPAAPTLQTPIGGTQIDYTQDTIFRWKHNDAGQQSKFDFRWRVQGSSTWTTINRTTTEQAILIGANTFPEETIEWQVRTYDNEGLVGPYSNSALFISEGPSNAPTIIAPTQDEIITTSNVTIEWVSANQTDYEVQLISNNVVLWSKTEHSLIDVVEIPTDLDNSQEYFIYVRTITSGGLWSSYSIVRFTTAFTPPPQPQVLFQTDDFDGSIILTILNPAPDIGQNEPDAIKNEIYRRIFDNQDDFVRIADNVEVNATYTDYMVGSGVYYEYLIRTYGDNGTVVDSEPIVARIIFKHAYLCVASDPANFVRLIWNPDRTMNFTREVSLLKFSGREYPVAEYGPHAGLNYAMTFDIFDNNNYRRFMEFINTKETLLYRDNRGRRDFISIETVSIKERQPKGYTVSFNPNKVDYNEGV